ncbi:MAG TPA: NAD-dependent epimerase/dehydratase family protein, partial [Planctomycetota bacterium]|nr:NAD-dependent epimerase/dehydratase family protein [Planctomycetota bacterium]
MNAAPTTSTIPDRDLDEVLAATRDLWPDLAGRRLFVTGGTGFFGMWLLETFRHANARLALGAEVTVLTRDAAAFRARAPHLAGAADVRLVAGDVRSFAFPEGHFAAVVHAATPAAAAQHEEDPLGTLDTIVEGTRRALDFAAHAGAKRFLLTSSGAVYGRHPTGEPLRVPEDFRGGPDPLDPRASYAEGKRLAEHLGALYHARHGIAATAARCYACLGPHLQLDTSFAMGNFIRDGLRGGPIRVNSDGT